MLPCRLFRNTGLPPPLRSLLTPSPLLPSSYKVQLYLRLGIAAPPLSAPSNTALASRSRHSTAAPSAGSSSTNANAEGQSSEEKTVPKQALGKIKPKLSITLTCTIQGCGERSTHQFTRHSYEKGIVIVRCPGCKSRHLIADHLGWFKESTKDGKLPTIEDIMEAKGEKIEKGIVYPNGSIEFSTE